MSQKVYTVLKKATFETREKKVVGVSIFRRELEDRELCFVVELREFLSGGYGVLVKQFRYLRPPILEWAKGEERGWESDEKAKAEQAFEWRCEKLKGWGFEEA